jgi:hypothetical protein
MPCTQSHAAVIKTYDHWLKGIFVFQHQPDLQQLSAFVKQQVWLESQLQDGLLRGWAQQKLDDPGLVGNTFMLHAGVWCMSIFTGRSLDPLASLAHETFHLTRIFTAELGRGLAPESLWEGMGAEEIYAYTYAELFNTIRRVICQVCPAHGAEFHQPPKM